MINLVVWIWQYQESETYKYRESRCQKWNQDSLLPFQKHIYLFPTAHSIFPLSWLNIFFSKISILYIAKSPYEISRNNTKKKMFTQDEGKMECTVGSREILFWQGKKTRLFWFHFWCWDLRYFICLWPLVLPNSNN